MSKAILLTLLLTACAASGPMYSGQGNVIIYRNDNYPFTTDHFSIQAGNKSCRLADKGFIAVNSQTPIEVTATRWGTFGTSKITANPGDFVEISHDYSAIFGKIHSDTGPYSFKRVHAKLAAKDLQGLRQDCE